MSLTWSDQLKAWVCDRCTLVAHEQLVAEKNAAQSWPPGPAGREFGDGSVVVAGPGGLLEQLLGVSPG
jgi:hypothetical protein